MIYMSEYKFEKLSRDDEKKTMIMAGHAMFTIEQLEEEIKADSEVGRKLKSIEKELEKYVILPEFLEWALEDLNKRNDSEIEDRTKIYEMQHKTLTKTQKELDEYLNMLEEAKKRDHKKICRRQ